MLLLIFATIHIKNITNISYLEMFLKYQTSAEFHGTSVKLTVMFVQQTSKDSLKWTLHLI